MTHQKKWRYFSIIAVTLVGLGINLVAEAAMIKFEAPPVMEDLGTAAKWFWIGLFGLASVNAGISFMAEAVKHRIYHEMGSKNASES
jgi:hypothetical protein